jgi:hypothetical protein
LRNNFDGMASACFIGFTAFRIVRYLKVCHSIL